MSFSTTTKPLSQPTHQRLATADKEDISIQLVKLTLKEIIFSARKAIALATAAQRLAKQLPINAVKMVEQAAQEEASAIKGTAMLMELAKQQLARAPITAAATTRAAADTTKTIQEAACALIQAVQSVEVEQKGQKRVIVIKVLAKEAEQNVQKAERIAKTDFLFTQGLDATSDAILTVSGAMLAAMEDKNLPSMQEAAKMTPLAIKAIQTAATALTELLKHL